MEETRGLTIGLILDAVVIQLVAEQAVIHGIKRLSEVHHHYIRLVAFIQVGY